jgi:hypothetical protein
VDEIFEEVKNQFDAANMNPISVPRAPRYGVQGRSLKFTVRKVLQNAMLGSLKLEISHWILATLFKRVNGSVHFLHVLFLYPWF